MNINLEKLQIHFLGIGGLAFCLVCAYGFGVRPVLQTQERLQTTVAEAEQLQRVLPALQTQIENLNAQITARSEQLRERYSIVTQSNQPLLGIVSKLLTDRQIDLVNLREEAQSSAGQRTVVLQLSSDYADMVTFVNDLRKLDCPAKVSHLRLTPLDELGERCSATLTVHFSPLVPFPSPRQETTRATSTSGNQA